MKLGGNCEIWLKLWNLVEILKPLKPPPKSPRICLFWSKFLLSFSQISQKPWGGWVGKQIWERSPKKNVLFTPSLADHHHRFNETEWDHYNHYGMWHHLNMWAMQWTLCILQCNHYHCHNFSSLSLINSHQITSSSRSRHSKPHQNIVESISKELQVQHTRFCRGAPQTAGE